MVFYILNVFFLFVIYAFVKSQFMPSSWLGWADEMQLQENGNSHCHRLPPFLPESGIKFRNNFNILNFREWCPDIDAYEKYWPEGTRERVWLHVLLYTGLRRGDAVRLGRQHVQNGVASLKTEKSGFKTEVTLPILPVLQRTLDVGPTGDLAFICGVNGNSLTKEIFSNLFRKAARAAGIIKSAHGIRKISATRAANAGATVAQLKAIFGQTDDEMPSFYTKSADRRKLALDAIGKLQK